MVKNILIVRLSAIGDCIETLPMAAAIKRSWPDSNVTWIVDCGVDSILKTQPTIDRVIRLKKGFLKRPSELLKLRRDLLKTRFDIAIDPQGLFKSAALAYLSGARRRIGFAPPQSREKAWWFYSDRVQFKSSHLVDRHLELLKPLSIPIAENHNATFDWVEPDDTANQAAAALASLGLKPNRYLCVNPSAGWPSKMWPRERHSEVIQRAAELYGLESLVIWGSPAEKSDAEWIVANSNTTKAHLAPPTHLMLLSGLLKRAMAYIGSDTGPMHLSVAVGTRCIALFGPTSPTVVGPYGIKHIAIQKMDGSHERDKRTSQDNYAMRAIAVDDVLDGISSLL